MKYKTYEDIPEDTIERRDAFMEICSKLNEFANMEGTELGEATVYMTTLQGYSYLLSPEFAEELEKELFCSYAMFHEDFEVLEETVEEVHTYTKKSLSPK